MILKTIDIRCDKCKTSLFEGGCSNGLTYIRKVAAEAGWRFIRPEFDARWSGRRIMDLCPKCASSNNNAACAAGGDQ